MEARLTMLQATLTPEALQDAVLLFTNLLEDDPSDVWLRWRYAGLRDFTAPWGLAKFVSFQDHPFRP
jgi:hypothetical protein